MFFAMKGIVNGLAAWPILSTVHPFISNLMNDETLERLESKLAFLERASQELSDVVYRQQQEIAGLRLQVAELLNRIETIRSEPAKYAADDERPPHY
jgi:SlyX protein